jgi:hypothetical protein
MRRKGLGIDATEPVGPASVMRDNLINHLDHAPLLFLVGAAKNFRE